jgi:tRNA-splicing ligase RtcB (3'-phosphate/5'-hydroxy nucleic acid ligase)
MIELVGKYNRAIVYTDNIEGEAIAQIRNVLNKDTFVGSQIRIMPDVHAGKGCTIGTTMTIKDKVVPNLVGVDVGCGVLVSKLKQKEIDLKRLDEVVRQYVPSGFDTHDGNIHKEAYEFHEKLETLKCYSYTKVKPTRIINSIGTLGGGNHFIAIEQDEEGNNYLLIHSGSRNLGVTIATFYQEIAVKLLENRIFDFNMKKRELIDRLKSENRHQEIPKEIAKLEKQKPVISQLDKDLAHVEGEDLENYLHDVKICQEYATLNRQCMTKAICDHAGLDIVEQFETVHNYIDLDNMILRKGAVSSQAGEKLVIPINMRDGSIIAVGKGNSNWNYSAPHGAGRLMSRKKAKEMIDMASFEESMKGIFTTSVNVHTIDEAPFAYKPMEEILNHIDETVNIICTIKPIYNYKDSTQ